MNRTIWITGLTIALIAGIVLIATAAGATEVVAIDTVHQGDPGDLFHEGTIEAVGACTATLRYTNGPAEEPSDHPNTDILVGPLTFTNVERGSFVDAALTFVGTGSTDVTTRIGDDGISSGGFTLEATCNPPTTTTTVPETSPSTTHPRPPTTGTPPTTSAPPATTTTEPAPIGGVSTGGGACVDGSCVIGSWSLTTRQTWIGLGGAAVLVGLTVLAWAFVAGGTRKEDPPYELRSPE